MDDLRRKAENLLKTLLDRGFQAYFSGGCVRDMVMGVKPQDYDIATDATPQEVIRIFPRCHSVGAQFGVVVVMDGGDQFQVATFRSDLGYADGRHPDRVVYTSAREDVKRRDFTINGMLYQPFTDELIDLVGGEADIRARTIRTIGDPALRFSEDKLRMMRAVRFAVRFDFTIEESTFEAIEKHAREILQVSWERIRDELLKVLTGPRPANGIRLLDRLGILQHILPEITALKGVRQPPQFHPEGDVWNHLLIMLEKMHNPSPVLAMAVLLHDVGKPETFSLGERIRFDNHSKVGEKMAEEVCRRLRFSRKEMETIKSMVALHLRFMHVRDMRPGRLKRFLQDPHFMEHLELHRLDCLGSHGDLGNYQFCLDKLRELKEEKPPPEPLVSGHDLIAMGFTPGPMFKEILTEVEEAQLEGGIISKDQAREMVLEKYAHLLPERHDR
jgi:poly(A) polymerase